ncbi:hypothetical protein O0I10_009089 [Lichtheimia ornata]|uniref:Major facilitator superfamily (MFS) profile domain-containing protein n=1 Tax=Lichtheimia ornata TaxID=688661 RepID=A0AAD7XWC5_9FUNG|nr:uncharacterized protein O0I10_009089 [Lichtheimia ornata]KAJ8655221.1 hypothetical protein O0I10_009089 [Lichtheimia ornata]
MTPLQNHDHEGPERKQYNNNKANNEPQHHVEEDESNESTMGVSMATKSPAADGSDPYYTEGWHNPGWLSTLSLFLVSFGVVGFMFSWGAFQHYYLEHVYGGQTDSFHIAFVGTIAYMLSTSLGLPMGYIIYYIGYRRTMMIGTVLCPLALFLASVANELWQTALSHGVMYGLGASFCVSATFVLPSQWFIKRRSLANGIGNMGVPAGGICFSPLTQYLLDTLGHRNALRTMACILFVVFSLATILIRARYPPKPPQYRAGVDDEQDKKANTTRSPLLSTPFILFLVFLALAPFGYLIPFYLMPTYATQALGASGSLGAAMVSVASASNCISRLVWGFAADRYGNMNTLIFTTGVSGALTMVLWQLSSTLPMYTVYCLLVGFSAAMYMSLMPSIVASLVGMDYLYTGAMLSWMIAAIGGLLGTPVFMKLQASIGWTGAIQLAGGSSIFATLCLVAARLWVDRRIISKL